MRLHWSRQELALKHTFTIARSSASVKETLLVELEHEGVVGTGEAIPTSFYGQSLASAEAELAEIASRHHRVLETL